MTRSGSKRLLTTPRSIRPDHRGTIHTRFLSHTHTYLHGSEDPRYFLPFFSFLQELAVWDPVGTAEDAGEHGSLQEGWTADPEHRAGHLLDATWWNFHRPWWKQPREAHKKGGDTGNRGKSVTITCKSWNSQKNLGNVPIKLLFKVALFPLESDLFSWQFNMFNFGQTVVKCSSGWMLFGDTKRIMINPDVRSPLFWHLI